MKPHVSACFGAAAATMIVFAAAVSAQAPAQGLPASARPAILDEIGIDQRLDAQIPLDLPFVDDHGRAVRLADYFGRKPVVLSLAYYECPMLCTQVLNGLASALAVLSFDIGKEFEVVTVSFDPGEGPGLASGKKRAYLERYGRKGAENGWHFLTGTEDSIRKLAAATGFRYRYVKEIDQYAHAAGIMVLTPSGRLARYFYGIEYSPRDLRFGLVEASHDRIGTPADRLMLLCYHYDPATGKYGAAALTLVRAGGVATIAALGLFLVTSLRRDRKVRLKPDATNGLDRAGRPDSL